MANSLNRTIEKGEVVVVSTSYLQGGMGYRAFVCDGTGFGCCPDTAGTAIFGEWWVGHDGARRIEGYMIDPEQTGQFQAILEEQEDDSE